MSSNKFKVVALAVIERTIKAGQHGDKLKGIPPVKPEVQTIEPGTVFLCKDDKEYNRLKDLGSVRDYNADDARAYKNLSHVVGEYEEDDGEGEGNGSNEDSGTAAVKKVSAKAAKASTNTKDAGTTQSVV